jgi:cellulose synthase operon protein YhjQ
MTRIGVISMKGGVGKTSVCVNLACALVKRWRGGVTVVDLDPQGAAPWHLGVGANANDGLCKRSVVGKSWRGAAIRTEWGVDCVPYGVVTHDERKALEALLATQPEWLAKGIKQVSKDSSLVLIDTPPGPSPYLRQVLRTCDLLIVVLLADAGSYATVRSLQTLLQELGDEAAPPTVYVVNQLDAADRFAGDVCAVLRQQVGAALSAIPIHYDEAMREAVAFQRPVLQYDPHGQASYDLDKLSRWLVRELEK